MLKVKRWPETEADLAGVVVEWLRQSHWEVFQEVQMARYGSVADIVATQNGIVWAIECKKTACLDVLAQAENWRMYAHYASIAVPRIADRSHRIVDKILKHTGIGRLRPSEGGYVIVDVEARLNRQAFASELLHILTDEHKTFAQAGTDTGKRWTPFRQTCELLRKEVESKPGISLKDAIDSFRTHYSDAQSARSSLKHWIEAGKVDGVRLVRDGRRLLLYPPELVPRVDPAHESLFGSAVASSVA